VLAANLSLQQWQLHVSESVPWVAAVSLQTPFAVSWHCVACFCAELSYPVVLQAGRKALAHPDISTAAVMPFTQPGLFLRFERDAAGCISLSLLLHYISMQTSALRLVREPCHC
jgi:hypothetical protein